MNIKERFENFLDEKKIRQEMKLFHEKKREEAKKDIANMSEGKNQSSGSLGNMLVNKKKFNFEQLKEVGLVAVAIVLIGVRLC